MPKVTAHLSIPFLELLAVGLSPIARPLSFLVRGFVRLFGVRSTGFHPLMQTPEELRMLVTHGTDPGEIEADEREMIRGVFEFAETLAREVMTPRTAMVALPASVTFDELVRVAIEEGHSRYPVYEDSIDNIIGLLLAKEHLRQGAPVERACTGVGSGARRKHLAVLVAAHSGSDGHTRALPIDRFGSQPCIIDGGRSSGRGVPHDPSARDCSCWRRRGIELLVVDLRGDLRRVA